MPKAHLEQEALAVLGRYVSLYVVTRQNGHWGIRFGSGNGPEAAAASEPSVR
jgi:hypothetical protein